MRDPWHRYPQGVEPTTAFGSGESYSGTRERRPMEFADPDKTITDAQEEAKGRFAVGEARVLRSEATLRWRRANPRLGRIDEPNVLGGKGTL